MRRCRGNSKATAFLLLLLLAGSDCVRIQNYATTNAASSQNSSSLSKWMWNYGSPACPMSYNVDVGKERYHAKVQKLYNAVEALEAQDKTPAFLWRLREIGQRLEGLATCAFTAVAKPALLETVKDATTGLKSVEITVWGRVFDQLRRHRIINWPETSTCKVMLESIREEQIRTWNVGSQVDVVSSTRVLIFGADCDVDKYLSSPELTRTSRKVLQALRDHLVKFAVDSQQQGKVNATQVALQRAAQSLETMSPDDYRDDSESSLDEDALALVQMDVGSQISIPWPTGMIGNLIAVILLTVIVIGGFVGITTAVSNLFSSNDDDDTYDASSYQDNGAENNTAVETAMPKSKHARGGRKKGSKKKSS